MKTSIKTVNTMSIGQWAQNLAIMGNTLAESAKSYQVAYASATPEQQHDLRVEWRMGYVMGKCSVDAVKAAQIVGQKRAERTAKHEAAVNLANKQFATYVACTSQRATQKAAPVQQVSIPRALKAGVAELLASYDYATVLAALKAAKAAK